MNKLEEFEKKNQQLKEKYQKEKETVSRLKKENILLKKEMKDKNILLGSAPAGIVLIWRGRILEVNDTFLGYMGYRADEMLNRNFLNFIHPDNLSEVRFIHNKWSAGKISKGQYDTRLVTENDEALLCSIEAKRVRYRGRASYLLNITRLEDREKTQIRKRLEIRNITELKMAEGLKSSLMKKSDSLTDLLKFFRGSNGLQKEALEQAIEKLKFEQEDIQQDVYMLKSIISENEEYQDKKEIEINRIINEAVDRVKKEVETGEIEIKKYLRTASSIYGNPGELVESLTQLLLNSISNIFDAGEIHITTEENAGKIYVYVQDSGFNVGESKIENIFEPFNINNSSLVHELGMRFVKAVITRHRGEIEYLPGRGQGNIFQITIPVFQETKKRKKIDRNKLKKARILIIQPEDIAKELLAHLLIEKGCRVDKVGNSIEGLVSLKKKKINMLIVDIESLGININAFWKKCRQINPKLITVALSNVTNISNKKWQKETDPHLIISKPFDIKDTVNRISELFMVEY